MCSLILFVPYRLFIKCFCYGFVIDGRFSSKRMLLVCYLDIFLLDSFVVTTEKSEDCIVINFVKMLFPVVSFVFLYLFVYVKVSNNSKV